MIHADMRVTCESTVATAQQASQQAQLAQLPSGHLT